ncbi:MAG: NUDIX domain-containing protein, partial [Allomuricauda sp.]
NQGIMEFGAIQCAPKNPDCERCPLNESCVALKENKVFQLPIKINKTKVRQRYFNYLVYLDGDKRTILEQRQGKGIWQNLYQFPLLETEDLVGQKELTQILNGKLKDAANTVALYNKEPIVHKLSHQHLHTRFWILETDELNSEGIPWEKVPNYPVPVLLADFIKTFKI